MFGFAYLFVVVTFRAIVVSCRVTHLQGRIRCVALRNKAVVLKRITKILNFFYYWVDGIVIIVIASHPS